MQNLPQKQPNNILLIAFLGAMVLVLILGLVLIFRPKPVPPVDTSQRTRDSVILLTTQIEDQKKITDHYLGVVDSLKALPPRIKIIYREQKKFTSTATINQLDSIIRIHAGISKTR